MIINELRLPPSMMAADIKLTDAGWIGIGRGAYGSVYHKPGFNYVLKLFSGDDLAYRTFLSMVMSNPNIHFPQFRGKLIRVVPRYYAIRMEKLDRTTEIDVSFDELMYMDAYISLKRGYDPSDDNDDGWWFQNATIWASLEENQSLCYALDLIAQLNFPLDLKLANIMKRGDTLVFTDPVCGRR